jgi:hypothetical protein
MISFSNNYYSLWLKKKKKKMNIRSITEYEFTKLNIIKNPFYKSGKEGEILLL